MCDAITAVGHVRVCSCVCLHRPRTNHAPVPGWILINIHLLSRPTMTPMSQMVRRCRRTAGTHARTHAHAREAVAVSACERARVCAVRNCITPIVRHAYKYSTCNVIARDCRWWRWFIGIFHCSVCAQRVRLIGFGSRAVANVPRSASLLSQRHVLHARSSGGAANGATNLWLGGWPYTPPTNRPRVWKSAHVRMAKMRPSSVEMRHA